MTALAAINEQNAEWYGNRRYELCTISIANPGVVTKVNHQLNTNDRIKLFTTGALPTGLSSDTFYYVIPKTDDTFTLAATPSGTPIETTGSQSGSHYYAAEVFRMKPAFADNR